MSNSIVGNNGSPVIFHSWFDGLNGELVDEENIFGYRAIVPNNSNSNTVTIFYYYQAPTSEWYWDYNYGVPYKPITPVVFSADASWNLIQCLNSSFVEISLDGQANGWKSINVTLKRNLVKGERIIFGVYSDLLGYVATSEVRDSNSTMCYFYWSHAQRNDYGSQISYVSSQDFISQQTNIFCDYEMCIFMQYENEPDGFFYTRTVLGNVKAAARLGRKHSAFRRTLNKAVFSDAVQKKVFWLRTCFIKAEASDRLSKSFDFRKVICISANVSEKVFRSEKSCRSFKDSAGFNDVTIASRIFYRAVKTAMGLWDWLRGKICEANNVLTLFCPIADEIELECRI